MDSIPWFFALMKHLFKNMKTRQLKYKLLINDFFFFMDLYSFPHLDLFGFFSKMWVVQYLFNTCMDQSVLKCPRLRRALPWSLLS